MTTLTAMKNLGAALAFVAGFALLPSASATGGVGVTPGPTPNVQVTVGPDTVGAVQTIRPDACGNAFAGGTFSTVTSGGTTYTRIGLFKYQRSTGALLAAFNANLTGSVASLAVTSDCNYVYVGGKFTVGGRSALVKLDARTGSVVTAFNPAPTGPGAAAPEVQALAWFGSTTLVAGGNFPTIGGTAQGYLASLNPTTGAATTLITTKISGVRPTGGTTTTSVNHLGVTLTAIADMRAASHLAQHIVVTGNFALSDGYSRGQIIIVGLSASRSFTSDWDATSLHRDYFADFGNWAKEVCMAPDGKSFATANTGGAVYGGISDALVKWNLSTIPGGLVSPTWVQYFADSAYSCATDGVTAYVGGHFRWANNSQKIDPVTHAWICGTNSKPCPGAVDRSGIAAIDWATGRATAWNAVRTKRGHGTEEMYLDASGLYVGSDTDTLGCTSPAGFDCAGQPSVTGKALGFLPRLP